MTLKIVSLASAGSASFRLGDGSVASLGSNLSNVVCGVSLAALGSGGVVALRCEVQTTVPNMFFAAHFASGSGPVVVGPLLSGSTTVDIPIPGIPIAVGATVQEIWLIQGSSSQQVSQIGAARFMRVDFESLVGFEIPQRPWGYRVPLFEKSAGFVPKSTSYPPSEFPSSSEQSLSVEMLRRALSLVPLGSTLANSNAVISAIAGHVQTKFAEAGVKLRMPKGNPEDNLQNSLTRVTPLTITGSSGADALLLMILFNADLIPYPYFTRDVSPSRVSTLLRGGANGVSVTSIDVSGTIVLLAAALGIEMTWRISKLFATVAPVGGSGLVVPVLTSIPAAPFIPIGQASWSGGAPSSPFPTSLVWHSYVQDATAGALAWDASAQWNSVPSTSGALPTPVSLSSFSPKHYFGEPLVSLTNTSVGYHQAMVWPAKPPALLDLPLSQVFAIGTADGPWV